MGVAGIFSEIRRLGAVSELEMSRVFNLGLGMVMVVAQGSEGQAMAAATSLGGDRRPGRRRNRVGRIRRGGFRSPQ